jgi:hypothetical protein
VMILLLSGRKVVVSVYGNNTNKALTSSLMIILVGCRHGGDR